MKSTVFASEGQEWSGAERPKSSVSIVGVNDRYHRSVSNDWLQCPLSIAGITSRQTRCRWRQPSHLHEAHPSNPSLFMLLLALGICRQSIIQWHAGPPRQAHGIFCVARPRFVRPAPGKTLAALISFLSAYRVAPLNAHVERNTPEVTKNNHSCHPPPDTGLGRGGSAAKNQRLSRRPAKPSSTHNPFFRSLHRLLFALFRV